MDYQSLKWNGKDMITQKTFNQVAQLGHFAGGLAAVYGTVALFGIKNIGWGFASLLVIAAIKEFWYDYQYETTEVRGSSLEDFLFYVLGGVIALASTLMVHKF